MEYGDQIKYLRAYFPNLWDPGDPGNKQNQRRGDEFYLQDVWSEGAEEELKSLQTKFPKARLGQAKNGTYYPRPLYIKQDEALKIFGKFVFLMEKGYFE